MLKSIRKSFNAYLFIIPAFIFIGVVMIYPIFQIIIYSLSDWSGFDYEITGNLKNYIAIFNDPIFRDIIKNNFIILCSVPITILIGVITASLLYDNNRGSKFYQILYFIPIMLPVLVVGIVWGYILRTNGPINSLLEFIGLESITRSWLSDIRWALPSVMGVIIWKDIGFAIILFLSTLLSVPPSIFEAAKIDGASKFQIFLHIKLPMLYSIIYIYGVLGIIWSFTNVFSYVYVLTEGGPGYATTVIEYAIYSEAFYNFRFGYASALSVIVFLIIMILLVIYIKVIRLKEV